MSKAAFARRHGKSKTAVTKWAARGRVFLDGDQVDVEKSDALLKDAGLGMFAKDRQNDGLAPAPRAPKTRPPKDQAAPAPEAPLPDIEAVLETADVFIADVTAGRYATQAQAERIKENALALKHVLEVRERAGQLIEMAVAEAVFFETSRADRDAWLNWPARTAPLIAAELGIEPDKVRTTLQVHVQRHLEELGEPQPDFTDAE